MRSTLRVVGAAEHNLRGVTAEVPHGELVVVCGVSGSGKTSLAFDTLHAESQRRFVESMSSWVRSQVGQAPRPVYETMTGLLPSIGVAQRGPGAASIRATVATSAELYDLFRVLYSRAGTLHCPTCAAPIRATTVDSVVRDLVALPDGTPLTVLARVAHQRTTPLGPLLDGLGKQGFLRVRVDGQLVMLDEPPKFAPGPHDVELVVDRIKLSLERRERVQEAVATALKAGRGAMSAEVGEGSAPREYATRPYCPKCDRELPPLSPRLFSFNTPIGACRACQGVGIVQEVEAGALVEPALTLAEGAVLTWGDNNRPMMLRWAAAAGIATDIPWSALPWESRDRLLNGDALTEGMLATAKKRPDDRWTREKPCAECAGARLSVEARFVKCAGRTLPERLSRTVAESLTELAEVPAGPLTTPVLEELERRLSFLARVGLEYITLDRGAASLSSGEWQRLRLGAQVGNQLSGVLYVLDEPTAGLHPDDTARLICLLRELCELGNTVLVVEHDDAVIDAADRVIEVGPGAGVEGGLVVFSGTPAELRVAPTLTGRWLRGEAKVAPHAVLIPRRFVRLEGLSGRNLRGDAELPLGVLAAVTGPSGAGKSSLIFDTLVPALTQRPGLPVERVLGSVARVVKVDGSPLPKAGRSTVATASRIFETIRQLFARTPEAKARGFGPERFSTAVAGGRCEACHGEGARRVAMHVLPDVVVPCEVCDGKRFDEATLSATYKGHSIGDVLAARVHEARALFGPVPGVSGVLETLDALGLGYLPLGQGVDTLSGGEAQRLKLARELGKPGEVAGALYVLDEPSVGLHPADLAVLLEALRRLVTMGASVIVVEHEPRLVAACDWEIAMGPGAGALGGRVVYAGPVRGAS